MKRGSQLEKQHNSSSWVSVFYCCCGHENLGLQFHFWDVSGGISHILHCSVFTSSGGILQRPMEISFPHKVSALGSTLCRACCLVREFSVLLTLRKPTLS